ncbi:hypothetical protein PybrP1_007381 [[Pythium] brassicae (nom. inval.)]|nr:hypothetical protein PybrP1_007381 [[Pythium] brassicae (nom. inval.)]
MGFAHALEALHAAARVAQQQAPQTPGSLAPLPFPHLQQRLQQALGGVALAAALATALPLVALGVLPGALFARPSVLAFALLLLLLTAATLAQLLARFALLPSPRPFLPDRASIHGGVQTLLCALFDAGARLVQEPQLLVLLTLCVLHSWLWKRALYALTTGPADADADPVAAHFGAFVLVGGLVAFASLLGFEASVAEDPFVLDPRAALRTGLQRDVVRAVRRGALVWGATRALLVLAQARDEPLVSLRFARAFFQIATSAAESFAWLSTASMFRLQLFRARHSALERAAADGSLYDALSVRPAALAAGFSLEELLAGGLAVDAQAGTPLSEQYVVALRTRVDGALTAIAARKVGARESTSVALENAAALDALFQFSNLLLATQFDPGARRALFASETHWHALVERATSALDSFTLSLQLLNAVPERKNQGDEKLARALEQSVARTAGFVLARAGTNPLLLLDEHPHLANLRIPRAAVKSKVRYYVEARAQFAVRRFLVEEARRRVFLRYKHTVPAVLTSLVECRNGLARYLETCLKNGAATDAYMKEADALARGVDKGIYRVTTTFYGELETFAFPPEVKSALQAYASGSV